ncbi:hypothetical protein [uncultured Clostridium sp.]|uniref:hypothetical protein n=1 Tax=uncultured Clostridium sp. TaxID=59620 RepID=UPI0025DFA66C|nr:hypothetical protein [uncultured Clostridium sp.]
MSTKKNTYLPKVRTNYHPTKEDCQTSSKAGKTTNIPNPATDPIVVNNIASQEFDYTQDMMDANDVYPGKSEDSKKY